MSATDITGSALSNVVTSTVTPLLTTDQLGSPRDALIVTLITTGAVLRCDDHDEPDAGSFPALAGVPTRLPFRSGQVWAKAYATTDAGEALDSVDVLVRPVVESSALQRSLWAQVGALFTSLLSRLNPCSSSAYPFDVELLSGIDYVAGNHDQLVVPIGGFDVSGRTIEARMGSTVLDWISCSVINAGQIELQSVVMECHPETPGSYVVDLVAVGPSDDKELVRGRVKVS